jgi:hypothetical protein
MNSVDRPEGFKEKQAELTASKIYSLGMTDISAPPIVDRPPVSTEPSASTRSKAPKASPPPAAEPDFDDIPF